MYISKEEEVKQIQKQILTLSIIDMIATMLVGLGLYAVFGANGNAVPEVLNDKNVAYGAIIIGGATMAWCFVKILPLLRRKAQLASEGNT